MSKREEESPYIVSEFASQKVLGMVVLMSVYPLCDSHSVATFRPVTVTTCP